jgi:hypothetical protein
VAGRAERVAEARVVRVAGVLVVVPRPEGDGARVHRVLRLAVAVRGLEEARPLKFLASVPAMFHDGPTFWFFSTTALATCGGCGCRCSSSAAGVGAGERGVGGGRLALM